MLRRVLAASVAVLLQSMALSAAAQAPAAGQAEAVTSRYVDIDRRINALVWRPATPGAKANVVLVSIHDESNNIDNMAGPNMARRGYTVITANARTAPDPEDRDTDWDKVILDVGSVVRYARALPGVTRVVVWGHSSGGPLMAAYQNIAEHGVAACQDARKVLKCPDSLAGLPRADGVILTDPIFGVGANVLASVDPAITDANPRRRDPALDVYDPRNGFDPKGAAYPAAFRRAYFAAQGRRNNATIAAALVRYEAVKAGRGRFVDDEPFLVAGASRRPRIWPADLHLLAHTHDAWPLIRADGSVSIEIIRSVRPAMGNALTSDRLGGDGALDTSVRRFLSTFATRALPDFSVGEDAITGVDWASSYSNTPGNVEGITVPFLTMGMTGHYWIVSAEMAYRRAGSADKSIAFVEGATHGVTACQTCGGDYGDTVGHFYDYVAAWLAPRF